jgi:CubicO group peptidase (beta-lactamase class C family)
MEMQRAVASTVYLFVSLIILITVTTICYSQSSANFNIDSQIPSTINELKTRINNMCKQYKIPGVGIALVSKDSIIWIGTIGSANIETGEPITEKTLFRIGSCTKSFIGLGFLKLIEEGKIDLDMPVRELVPEIEIENPWKDIHPVRIVHLLDHTAGFDDSHINSIYNKEDPEMPLKQALDIKADLRRVRWQPGTRYSYSSPGYTLAGYILEKVTGQRYEDYLKEAILKPIGMKSSTFRLTDECKQFLARGYQDNYEPIPYFEGYDRPASSLISSPKEMALFIQFMLNSGSVDEKQIISAKLIDQVGIPSSTIAAKAGLTNGYSFGFDTDFQDGFKWLNHTGGGPGCIAKYAYIKENGIGYTVMANRFIISEFEEMCRMVQRYLIGNMNPPSPQPAVKISGDQLKKYCGYYEYLSSRQQLVRFMDILLGGTTISFENDTLYQQDFMSSKVSLIPVSSNMFRKSNQPEASTIFTSTPEGTMVFATLGSYYENSGSWKLFVYRTLFFSALIIMVSSIIYMFFWIPVHLFKILRKKENRSKYLRMRVIPLLAILSLVFGTIVVGNQSLVTVGMMTINNIIFFISTLLFAGLSIISLIFSIISFKKPVKMFVRVYALLLSLACFGMTIYLSYWGIIGLRIWAY